MVMRDATRRYAPLMSGRRVGGVVDRWRRYAPQKVWGGGGEGGTWEPGLWNRNFPQRTYGQTRDHFGGFALYGKLPRHPSNSPALRRKVLHSANRYANPLMPRASIQSPAQGFAQAHTTRPSCASF